MYPPLSIVFPVALTSTYYTVSLLDVQGSNSASDEVMQETAMVCEMYQ